MKQVFQIGKFYGTTRQEILTPGFAFVEVEDCDNLEVPLHTHENAHFLFVMKGGYEGRVRDKKQIFSPSSVIYYPAGTTHRDHFYNDGERRFLTVSLTSKMNQRLLEELKFTDHSLDFKNPEIYWLGKRICREIQSPDSFSSVVLEGMATELMVYAARDLDELAKPPGWLKTARELIRDSCAESMTIAEIASAVGIHPLHLARTFRKFFGCSPGEYLRKCRIEMALDLLLHSKKTLAEIALATGFADQSQFTQSFRQSTGTTPAKFRRLQD